jgi:ferredoxin
VGGDENYIPVAINAGLGISGKSGLPISRHNRPRVRLAAVYTDIENLPYAQENPHDWVHTYCQHCNLCVQKCPARKFMRKPKPLRMAVPPSSITPNVPYRFLTTTAAACVSSTVISYVGFDTLFLGSPTRSRFSGDRLTSSMQKIKTLVLIGNL